MSKENVEIIAVQGPIAIDGEGRKQFADGQKEFDKYLDSMQRLQGTNELLMPLVAETDGGAIWCLFLEAGRYIIVPRYARPRNKKMRINKYSVFYSGAERKAIDYRDFLKEVDMSRRYDAKRSIIKLSKAEMRRIFDKYPDVLDRSNTR